jgi:hypothetical protein
MVGAVPAAAVLLLVLSCGSASAAQDPGVIRDPDSPAGQEYALPLDAERRTGAGDKAQAQEGTSPLFGIGIGPPGGGAGGPGRADGTGKGSDGTGSGRTGSLRGGDVRNASGDLSGGDTSSTTLAVLGGILLGGALIGGALRLAMRGRTRPA